MLDCGFKRGGRPEDPVFVAIHASDKVHNSVSSLFILFCDDAVFVNPFGVSAGHGVVVLAFPVVFLSILEEVAPRGLGGGLTFNYL